MNWERIGGSLKKRSKRVQKRKNDRRELKKTWFRKKNEKREERVEKLAEEMERARKRLKT